MHFVHVAMQFSANNLDLWYERTCVQDFILKFGHAELSFLIKLSFFLLDKKFHMHIFAYFMCIFRRGHCKLNLWTGKMHLGYTQVCNLCQT